MCPAGPTNGCTGKVFLVAELLADQHGLGMGRAFAEHGLGRVFPERAGAAIGRLFAQGFEAQCRRHGHFPIGFERD
jgi:hypothetical protein